MWKYVMQDLAGTVQYMPYGILIGGFLFVLLSMLRRKNRNEKKMSVMEMLFWIYLAIILVITFFSREGGSTGGVDLRIGSSLGINERNDAYAVENILLFLPYGFLLGIIWKCRKGFLKCTGVGFLTSFAIECLQYISGRGVFQTDDLITNTVGVMVGYLLFYLLSHVLLGKNNKKLSDIQ